MVSLIIGIILFFVGIFIDFCSVSDTAFKVGTAMMLIGAVIGSVAWFYIIGTSDMPQWVKFMLLSK